jgi:hypothetical protein
VPGLTCHHSNFLEFRPMMDILFLMTILAFFVACDRLTGALERL